MSIRDFGFGTGWVVDSESEYDLCTTGRFHIVKENFVIRDKEHESIQILEPKSYVELQEMFREFFNSFSSSEFSFVVNDRMDWEERKYAENETGLNIFDEDNNYAKIEINGEFNGYFICYTLE